MNGIKKIVLGLSVSVASILFAQQFATANTNIETSNNQKDDVKISLYKEAKADTLEATEISLDENIDIDNYKVSSEQNNIPITINDVKTISSKEEDTSPWVVAQSAKPQNKQEINNSKAKSKELPEELAKYRVAERIKQSIIFPIPEEILNDENLTPTFITPAPPVIEKKETRAKEDTSLKILPNIKNDESKNKEKDSETNNIISNISAWFSKDKEPTKTETKKAKSTPPTYSSKPTKPADAQNNNNINDLANFYESLQETKNDFSSKSISPTELKLSFRENRAEISGQTLKWLKLFADKTKKQNSQLQIKLNASTPIKLQKKRLNLLYTVFINNNVDLNKIDTVFSQTEPNSFVIRALDIN